MGYEVNVAAAAEDVVNNEAERREAANMGDIFVSVGDRDEAFVCVYLYRNYRSPDVSGDQFVRLRTGTVESIDGYLFPLRRLPRGSTVTLSVNR